jgi:hypothetical protein
MSSVVQEQEEDAPTPTRRRPRTSTLLLAASVLVGVALLLWGADRLARWGAETALARQIQSSTGVLTRPDVEVNGPFFLVQMARGRYDDVEVTIDGLSSGPLRIERMHAELRGVHLPFHDLLTRNSVPIAIESSREEATLRYDDLNDYLDATGRPVQVEAAPDGQMRLTGSVQIFGRTVSASARVSLEADDGQISVRPSQLDTGTGLDRASRLLLQQRFAFVVPMDPLPFGQRVTSIDPGSSGLIVEARGSDVVVQP